MAISSILKGELREVFQKIQTLQEAFQKGQDSSKHDLQLLRTDLKKEQGE